MGGNLPPLMLDAIKEAEDRTGRKAINIITPHFNILPGGDPETEPERVFDVCKEMGADICMPHQAVTDALMDKMHGKIRDIDKYTKMIRERGMIPGLSTHMPETVSRCHTRTIRLNRVNAHFVKIKDNVIPVGGNQRSFSPDLPCDLFLTMIKNQHIVQPVAFFLGEPDGQIRKIRNKPAGLKQVLPDVHADLRVNVAPQIMPARHDFIVDVKPQQSTGDSRQNRPLHHRQQIHATSPHRGDLTVCG